MGSSGLIINDEPVESTSLTKIFEKQCPYYMLYGMSYEQFWYGEPSLVKYYREFYKLKLREQDRYMWKQGMYIYEALCDVSPILHAFSKKGTKPLQYRDKPMSDEKDNELKTEEEKEQQIKNDRLIARIFFENWARATKKQFENKKD